MKRQPLTQRDKTDRAKALATLQDFAHFLRRGSMRNYRAPLTPARALDYLRDSHVTDLLGRNRTREIRKAAEVLL